METAASNGAAPPGRHDPIRPLRRASTCVVAIAPGYRQAGEAAGAQPLARCGRPARAARRQLHLASQTVLPAQVLRLDHPAGPATPAAIATA
jgi:hypothetical protein